MAELPATISEAEMIDTVAHWFDLFTKLLTTESSRLYTQIWLKRLVRQGTIPTVRVIQWANEGHADADIALRQVVAEMLDQSERPPATIAGYAAQALNRQPVTRRRGGDAADNLLRNQVIAFCVAKAIEFWHPHLPMSRHRGSKSPSACSVTSAALVKRRINIGEHRVEKIYRDLADLLPGHQTWRASLLSDSNPTL
jgi:hypothetical protein